VKIALATAFAFAAACSASTFMYLDGRTPGTFAPVLTTPTMMGIQAGATPLDAVKSAAERNGLVCEDASMTAIMMKAHAKRREGGARSVTSGMPSNHFAMLADPKFWQVRLSCDNAAGTIALGDAAVRGRFLAVHPSADKPVELMSFERHHKDRAAATADFAATLQRLEQLYGTPATAKGSELALLTPVDREWHIGGAIVKFRAIDFGARGVAISEEIRQAGSS
jgi:hypothetical protein